MNADKLSYRRATSVSLLGLAIQAVLAGVMIVYSRLGQDPAAFTAGIAMLLGLPVWATLALLFYQHTRERVEAMEAEMYAASSAADASVFEGADSELNVQAAKLETLYRWFLPIMSLIVGIAFAGLGAWRFMGREITNSETIYQAPPENGWAIAIGVGVAASSFVFARFVAGMAKQRVWMLLHAGSATSVLAALLGGTLALAHFLHAAITEDILLEYLPAIFSLAMIALGGEIFLNFVLNLYRPRTSDQTMRPAFDSRVLAFVAAPDRLAKSVSDAINYQFGFNVSSTWFYRLLSRTIFALVVLGGALIWAMTTVTIVQPGERGILISNGQYVREVPPGPIFKKPWPWSRVVTFPAESVNELVIGESVEERGPILWTKSHSRSPMFVIVQPSMDVEAESDASSSLSLLIAEVPVHYVVRQGQLRNYLSLAQDGPSEDIDRMRRDLLRAVATRVVIEHLSTIRVDQAVGGMRNEIAGELHTRIQTRFDELDSGVDVTFVGISGLHPSEEVAPSFEKLVAADQSAQAEMERAEAQAIKTLASVAGEVAKAERIIEELKRLEALERGGADETAVARQEQLIMELILDAGGQAAALIAEARADRWQQHMKARSSLALSSGQIAMYRAAPQPYLSSLLVEAYRAFARGNRVYMSPLDLRIELNQEEEQAAIGGYMDAIEYDPENPQQE